MAEQFNYTKCIGSAAPIAWTNRPAVTAAPAPVSAAVRKTLLERVITILHSREIRHRVLKTILDYLPLTGVRGRTCADRVFTISKMLGAAVSSKREAVRG